MDEDDNLGQIKKNLEEIRKVGHAYTKTFVKQLAAKWLLIIGLLLVLWYSFPHFQLVFLMVIPLAVFNLYQLYAHERNLAVKIGEIKQLIKEIEDE